jgi:hypothetical protein
MPLDRSALWIALAIWTVFLLRTPLPALGDSFIHLINLVFHEAGHILFAPFGSFMMSPGGSLLQVIVPLTCAWAFLLQQDDRFGGRCVGLRYSLDGRRTGLFVFRSSLFVLRFSFFVFRSSFFVLRSSLSPHS